MTKKGRTRYNHPRQISLETHQSKVVFTFSDREMRYYDLSRDPEELQALSTPPIETRPPLGRQLSDWYRELPKYEQRSGDLSEQDIQQLKSLGYLGGAD